MCYIPQSGCLGNAVSLAEKAFWGKGTDHVKETGAKCLAVECRQTRLAVWVWAEANCPLQWIGAFAICAGHGLAKAGLSWWNLVQTLYFTETRKPKPSLKKEPVFCKLPLQTSQLKEKHDSIVKPYKPRLFKAQRAEWEKGSSEF